MRIPSFCFAVLIGCFGSCAVAKETTPLYFIFGDTPATAGAKQVTAGMEYAKERGFGFEPGYPARVSAGGVTAVNQAFFFSAVVPEGNYRVKIAFTGAPGGSTITVKAELRRLMVEAFHLNAGERGERTFVVNVRTPKITAHGDIAAGEVRLKAPRETTKEAWAWDARLTLEIDGERPILSAITIEPVSVPTVFLLGDSTVCDQSGEPFASWGQMFTRFFNDKVAIANHAESGETYRDSLGRRRIDKIVSVLQPGDWVLMQFGHNDQKQIKAKTGGPFTTYEEEIKRHIAMIQKAGGIPVIVTPMERRNFDDKGLVVPTLADYAAASREAAKASGVALIDLNAMSIRLYEALGPKKAILAFAAPPGVPVEQTHHNDYGAYELAKCIAVSAREQNLGFASYLAKDFKDFSPDHPDDPATFTLPPTPVFTNLRPSGD